VGAGLLLEGAFGGVEPVPALLLGEGTTEFSAGGIDACVGFVESPLVLPRWRTG
jgi:hypothetical protein